MIRFSAFFALAALAQTFAAWTPGEFTELGTLPGHAVAWERGVTLGDRTVRVTGVSFSDKDSVFRVIENEPSARKSLLAALRDRGAVAGVNGGYFHPDFIALGGSLDQVNGLASQIGIASSHGAVEADGSYPVNHSTSILLIDPQARLTGIFSAPHDAETIIRQFASIVEFINRQD